MQTRQENEFVLFQQNETKLIKKNLRRFEKKEDFQLIYFTDGIYSQEGQKKFIYLLAALLKKGISYSLIYPEACRFLDGFIQGSFTGANYMPESKQEDSEFLKRLKRDNIRYKLRFLSLIVYAGCTYESLFSLPWFEHRDKNNEHIKIINRIYLFDQMHSYYFDDWEFNGGEEGVKQTRNKILTELLKETQHDEELSMEIRTLRNSPLTFKILGACVECEDSEKIHNMILKLNDRSIEKLAKQEYSYATTRQLFFANRKQTISLKAIELGQANLPKPQ